MLCCFITFLILICTWIDLEFASHNLVTNLYKYFNSTDVEIQSVYKTKIKKILNISVFDGLVDGKSVEWFFILD